jgi:hypothetical protein
MVFKIGNNDYSDKVLMDTYNVNRIDVYTEWEDANGTTHRDIYRHKVQGEFDMQISKLSDYQAFVADVARNKRNGGYVPCYVCINNENMENAFAQLFIDYTPIKTMNNNYTKGYLSFTVRVEER